MSRDQPIMLSFLPIMHTAVLFNSPIMLNIMLKNRNCCQTIMLLYIILHEQFNRCNFIAAVEEDAGILAASKAVATLQVNFSR